MKTKKSVLSQIGLAVFLILFAIQGISTLKAEANSKKDSKNKIKVALLLDTSNSMDGLIAQAKSQLWSIINKLSEAKIGDKKPELQIALYEYGNDGLSSENGYIRRVLPFGNDLDLISEKLFALNTNGGSEYCGQVISKSIKELDWQGNDNDLRLIFIAGNEAFNQGKVSYLKAANSAKNKNIVINPIFCGDFENGVRILWKDAAVLTNGKYMSIEHNKKTVYIDSPYDDEIIRMNNKLNKTYIPYGDAGMDYKNRQLVQDKNASVFGKVNCVKRAVCKSKVVYSNSVWDLVDAIKDSKVKLNDIDKKTLPKELQSLSKQELEKYVSEKVIERENVQNRINELNTQREKYVKEKKKATGELSDLENALIKSIEKQAIKKGYKF